MRAPGWALITILIFHRRILNQFLTDQFRDGRGREIYIGGIFLFVTFGHCQGLPVEKVWQGSFQLSKIRSSEFTHDILPDSLAKLATLWGSSWINCRLCSDMKVIFTISPVRHWKRWCSRQPGQQICSFPGCGRAAGASSKPGYFPAYELVMDDLRDYRFYDDDMLHPSSSAVSYIWERFSECYFDKSTMELWNEVVRITKAFNHRLTGGSEMKKLEFAGSMLDRIASMSTKFHPSTFLKRRIIL